MNRFFLIILLLVSCKNKSEIDETFLPGLNNIEEKKELSNFNYSSDLIAFSKSISVYIFCLNPFLVGLWARGWLEGWWKYPHPSYFLRWANYSWAFNGMDRIGNKELTYEIWCHSEQKSCAPPLRKKAKGVPVPNLSNKKGSGDLKN